MSSFTLGVVSTTVRTLASNENGFVTSSGSLITDSRAITINQGAILGTSSLTVLGAVHSNTSDAIGSVGETGNVNITVGTLGSLTSETGSGPINLDIQGRFRLTNAGLIAGERTLFLGGGTETETAMITNSGVMSGASSGSSTLSFGIDFDDVNIINTGVITHSGTLRSIFHQAATGELTVHNAGTISSNGLNAIQTVGQLDLYNSGTIEGAVRFSDETSIVNSGTLLGGVFDSNIGNGNTSLQNSGLITDGVTIFGNLSARLRNSGQIDGTIAVETITAAALRLDNLGGEIGGNVVMSGGAATVRNSGTLHGDLTLSNTNDVYDGTGGQVLGTIFGDAGNDLFTIDSSDVRINGGSGFDRVISSASYVMGFGIEFLDLVGDLGLTGIGRSGNESITGAVGNDRLEGRKGNDELDGGEGNDALLGGAGDDILTLSDGVDTLNGGAGIDTVLGRDVSYRYDINLNTNTASGIDIATGVTEATGVLASIENATGAANADIFVGSKGANRLQGQLGNDTLTGFDGDDTLIGDEGNDSLAGGKDDDVLIGGSGRDTMAGGAGSDSFVFAAVSDSLAGAGDRIQLFVAADDTIDLALVDSDPLAGGDQAFAFVGSAAFAGAAPQVRFQQDAVSKTTTIQVKFADQASPGMEIVLDSLVTLTADDFLL